MTTKTFSILAWSIWLSQIACLFLKPEWVIANPIHTGLLLFSIVIGHRYVCTKPPYYNIEQDLIRITITAILLSSVLVWHNIDPDRWALLNEVKRICDKPEAEGTRLCNAWADFTYIEERDDYGY